MVILKTVKGAEEYFGKRVSLGRRNRPSSLPHHLTAMWPWESHLINVSLPTVEASVYPSANGGVGLNQEESVQWLVEDKKAI